MKLKSSEAYKISMAFLIGLAINTILFFINLINLNFFWLFILLISEILLFLGFVHYKNEQKRLKHKERLSIERRKRCEDIYKNILPSEKQKLQNILIKNNVNSFILELFIGNIETYFKKNDPDKMQREIYNMKEHVAWLTGNMDHFKETYVHKEKSPFNQSKITKCLQALGLSSDEQDFKKIKEAYHSLMRIYHPDQLKNDTIHLDKAQEINSAYNYLKEQFN